MEYYYTPKEYISPGSLTIVDDEAKHLGRVLRKQTGAEIYVTDGEGNLYKTKITGIQKEIINCDILESFSNLNEPERKITLYQSHIKNPARFEFVIEKSVELGVFAIQPVISKNVVNRSPDKTARWQSIALAAMKQSQRCYLPKILPAVEFESAFKLCSSAGKLIADERDTEGRLTAADIDASIKTIDLFIGPEGGFTEDETSLAVKNGLKILKLGSRKYRSETAAILCVGLLLHK